MPETKQMGEDLRARYDVLASDRWDALQRARDAAKLTIPSLMVPEGHHKGVRLYQPYQSLGGRAVNNLASKLLLALMPPGQSFFKLSIEPFTLEQLKAEGGEEVVTEATKTLALMERAFVREMEALNDRVAAGEAFKQLLVSGNVLLYDGEKAGLKVFRLDEYVVRRDPEGMPIEIIIKEELHYDTLEPSVQALLSDSEKKRGDDQADLMTSVKWNGERYEVWQEVESVEIPDSRGTYAKDQLPYFPLRMITIDGEDYGRSFIEEYYGDLKSLEGLYQALVIFSAVAAKILFLVNPNGTTQQNTLSKANSGDIVAGNADDVSVLQMEKFNDFRVTFDTAQRIEARLEQAFLLTSSIQRDAERVTAEEIRVMVQELEQSLGGIYSVLTQEFQLKFVKVRLKRMEKRTKNWPKLDPDIVQPMVVTGLNALGRSFERDKLMQYLAALYQTLTPERAARYVNEREVANRLAIQMGIDTDGLIKTEEQIAQEDAAAQQAAQQSQMVDKLGPPAIKAVADNPELIQ